MFRTLRSTIILLDCENKNHKIQVSTVGEEELPNNPTET